MGMNDLKLGSGFFCLFSVVSYSNESLYKNQYVIIRLFSSDSIRDIV